MDFEYGCAITNKYMFLDENEVEDPSELLAQVAEPKGKQTKETTTAKTAKPGQQSGKQASNNKQQSKDPKKQPLQQQTENSVKSNKTAGGDPKKTRQPGNNNSGQQQQNQQPRDDKENSSNKTERRPGTGFRGNNDRRGDNNNDNQQRPPRRSGPRPEGGFDRPPRRVREGFGNDNTVQTEEGGEANNESGFRRTGNGGGFRGPRNQGASNYRNRREYDRHSGSEKTGVKHVDKKDGAGKGNWGTPEDELAAQENLNETQGEQTENNWAARVDESEEAKKDEEGGEENKEDHPNFMTLDEYKALRNEINKKNEFNIRRPGEGEDQSKWPKTYLLAKKKSEEEEEGEEEKEEEEEEAEEDKNKQLLNQIQFKFYEPPSSGRRGDRRGGDRGDRGDRRSGPRPQRQAPASAEPAATETELQVNEPQTENRERVGNNRQRNNNQRGPQRRGGPSRGSNQHRVNVPRIEDEKDFPSLGK